MDKDTKDFLIFAGSVSLGFILSGATAYLLWIAIRWIELQVLG